MINSEGFWDSKKYQMGLIDFKCENQSDGAD
jgi:hypothetical protein